MDNLGKLLFIILALNLMGCGGGSSDSSSADNTEVTEPPAPVPPPPPSPPPTATVELDVNRIPILDGIDIPVGAILALPITLTTGQFASATVTLETRDSGQSHMVEIITPNENSSDVLVNPLHDLIPGLPYVLTLSTDSESWLFHFKTASVNWHAGGYILFAVDQPIDNNTSALRSVNAQYTSGIAVRASWPNIEDDEGNYDFSYLDTAITAAEQLNKKVSISLLPLSQSLSEPAQSVPQRYFYALNRNPNNQNAGACSRLADPFDDHYRHRYYQFLHALGRHLQQNPHLNNTVSYVIGAGDMVTRNWAYGIAFRDLFSDADCTEAITWDSVGFNAESMITILQESVSVFMEAFPDKVLWFSVGDLRFDNTALSCGESYCVATEVADWALQHYPHRVGIWREDINARRNAPSDGTLWHEIAKYRPRIGAQMVSGVQGCPDNCRVDEDGTASDDALANALNVAISNDTASGFGYYLMNYVEIYAADVQSDNLNHVFQDVDLNARWLSDSLPPSVPQNLSANTEQAGRIELSWSASTDNWDKENSQTNSLEPSPSKAAQQTVVYRVWQNNDLIAETEQTELTVIEQTNTVMRFSVSAVDVMSNESARSNTVTIN